MEHFRALDTEVNMTVERETAGSDPGNLYPVTNEGLANEKGWLRTYALIENVLLAMVRFYDVEVDPETKPNGHHSFHMNLLNTFDRDTHSLYKALGKAKQSINELRKWRNWQKLSDQRKEPHKWSYGGGKMYYCVWYSEVYEDFFMTLVANPEKESEGEDRENKDTEGEDTEGEDTEGEDTEGEDIEREEMERDNTEKEDLREEEIVKEDVKERAKERKLHSLK
ncbi:MAG: hypothetical protein L6R41_002355 [Letrouitia leprolyta]|nr:MAG: hypothetical protein L6R41_002355 [Letrouitia leprolyta]